MYFLGFESTGVSAFLVVDICFRRTIRAGYFTPGNDSHDLQKKKKDYYLLFISGVEGVWNIIHLCDLYCFIPFFESPVQIVF